MLLPDLQLLAGPNGAGKSTLFDDFLAPTGIRFADADLIARALPPDNSAVIAYQGYPLQAGRSDPGSAGVRAGPFPTLGALASPPATLAAPCVDFAYLFDNSS